MIRLPRRTGRMFNLPAVLTTTVPVSCTPHAQYEYWYVPLNNSTLLIPGKTVRYRLCGPFKVRYTLAPLLLAISSLGGVVAALAWAGAAGLNAGSNSAVMIKPCC